MSSGPSFVDVLALSNQNAKSSLPNSRSNSSSALRLALDRAREQAHIRVARRCAALQRLGGTLGRFRRRARLGLRSCASA